MFALFTSIPMRALVFIGSAHCKLRRQFSVIQYLAVALALHSLVATAEVDLVEKISEFGHYQGYSEPLYSEYVRESVYVPMRDGVKVAVDIYRPAINGVAVETPLPVLLIYSRYRRAQEYADGSIKGLLGRLPAGQNSGPLEWNLASRGNRHPYLLAHGYVIARADARGTGASSGIYRGAMSDQEARDGHDIIEWLAGQAFSTGKVGTFGSSYPGQTQYLMVTQRPPSLKAMFPMVAYFDIYQSWVSGAGVFRKASVIWSIKQMRADGLLNDEEPVSKDVARVDADTDGSMRQAAYAERQTDGQSGGSLENVGGGDWMNELGLWLARSMFDVETNVELFSLVAGPTDELAEKLQGKWLLPKILSLPQFQLTRDNSLFTPRYVAGSGKSTNNLSDLLPEINAAGVPIYNFGGWRDGYTDATALWHANLEVPSKLAMGPWGHGPNEPNDKREDAHMEIAAIEQLRWFDYWLKGIDNGIMDEPAVHYALVHSPDTWSWQSSAAWPVDEAQASRFYFAKGTTTPVESVNDGELTRQPGSDVSTDSFTVDYAASMGPHDRYYDTIGGGPLDYPDMAAHARTALTYTSPVLNQAVNIAGHPVVHLRATSSAEDGDFMVYLEEVDADGTVHYVTGGAIRASYRTLGEPPYNYLGMPWSESTAAVVDATAPLNEGMATLAFPMKPVSNRFEKGHRIRVVVTGADADGTFLVPIDPAPTQSLQLGGDQGSYIELPILVDSSES
ncbi:MAG: CocE/NonD family hydrolase [Pseudomonadota bacterium]